MPFGGIKRVQHSIACMVASKKVQNSIASLAKDVSNRWEGPVKELLSEQTCGAAAEAGLAAGAGTAGE